MADKPIDYMGKNADDTKFILLRSYPHTILQMLIHDLLLHAGTGMCPECLYRVCAEPV